MLKSRTVKFIDSNEEVKRSLRLQNMPKKQRTRLDEWQLHVLEEAFLLDSHPSAKVKHRLATDLRISLKSVQIWFQNKRAKEKAMRERQLYIDENRPGAGEGCYSSFFRVQPAEVPGDAAAGAEMWEERSEGARGGPYYAVSMKQDITLSDYDVSETLFSPRQIFPVLGYPVSHSPRKSQTKYTLYK